MMRGLVFPRIFLNGLFVAFYVMFLDVKGLLCDKLFLFNNIN